MVFLASEEIVVKVVERIANAASAKAEPAKSDLPRPPQALQGVGRALQLRKKMPPIKPELRMNWRLT